jgi:transcription elongation factor Elf1
MNTKVCSKCNNEYPATNEFYAKKTKNSDGLQAHCKKCHSVYLKQHYLSNKKYYSDKAIKRKKQVRNEFNEYKKTLKCSFCPENDPVCLDFHHTDPTQKDRELADMVGRGIGMESLLKEVDKCIVLCSNCHRKLHAKLKTGR